MKAAATFLVALLALLFLRSGETAARASQPYRQGKVTQSTIDNALKKARTQKKILMIEFGANWCEDCLVLARTLEEGDTKKYFKDHFFELRVDVGRFDRNLEIMKALGVEMNAIPTAVFFDPDGSRIGATNKMELEPARKYGVRQILPFLKEISEQKRVTNPAQYQ